MGLCCVWCVPPLAPAPPNYIQPHPIPQHVLSPHHEHPATPHHYHTTPHQVGNANNTSTILAKCLAEHCASPHVFNFTPLYGPIHRSKFWPKYAGIYIHLGGIPDGPFIEQYLIPKTKETIYSRSNNFIKNLLLLNILPGKYKNTTSKKGTCKIYVDRTCFNSYRAGAQWARESRKPLKSQKFDVKILDFLQLNRKIIHWTTCFWIFLDWKGL